MKKLKFTANHEIGKQSQKRRLFLEVETGKILMAIRPIKRLPLKSKVVAIIH